MGLEPIAAGLEVQRATIAPVRLISTYLREKQLLNPQGLQSMFIHIHHSD